MAMQDYSLGWQERLPTVSLQIEFFLLKFPDVTRSPALEMAASFKKFDSRGVGELQEDEAMRLLESRGETKRFVELRSMVKEMDFDQNRELSMLEWACAYYGKSWKILHTPSPNQEEVDRAMTKLKHAMQKEIEAGERARKMAHEKEVAAQREEQRQQELERRNREEEVKRKQETSAQGIRGTAAKFHYAATDTKDLTKSNEEKIKAEAAARKEQKRLEEEKKKAEEEKSRAIEEQERAKEERRKVEEGAIEAHKKQQEDMKKKAEEEERMAVEKEKERKAKVQAALKAKFGNKD